MKEDPPTNVNNQLTFAQIMKVVILVGSLLIALISFAIVAAFIDLITSLEAEEEDPLVKVRRDKTDTFTTSLNDDSDVIDWHTTQENWTGTPRIVVVAEITSCEKAGISPLNFFSSNEVEYSIEIEGESQGNTVDCDEGDKFTHTFTGEEINVTKLQVLISQSNNDDGDNSVSFKVSIEYSYFVWIPESELSPNIGFFGAVLAIALAANQKQRHPLSIREQ